MMRWISKIIMTFNGLKLNKILFSLPLFLAPTRFKQSSSKCQRHLRSQTKLWRTSTQANSWFNQLFQPYESARSHEQYSDQKINSPIKDLFELSEKYLNERVARKELCHEHDLRKTLYCSDCRKYMCDKCYVLDTASTRPRRSARWPLRCWTCSTFSLKNSLRT